VTLREKLSRTKNRCLCGIVAGALTLGILGGVGFSGRAETALVVVAFFVVIGCAVRLLFGLRCPNCRGYLGYAIQWPYTFWGISEKIKYCPFCGVSLDTDEQQLKKTGPNER
jgi:hypothetical protein